MSDWQYMIHFKEEWDKWPDEVSTQELSKIIAKKLRELDCPTPDDIYDKRFEIAEEFEILACDPDLDVDTDDFDYIMEMLYDWGDTSLDDHFNGKKVCWIGAIL